MKTWNTIVKSPSFSSLLLLSSCSPSFSFLHYPSFQFRCHGSSSLSGPSSLSLNSWLINCYLLILPSVPSPSLYQAGVRTITLMSLSHVIIKRNPAQEVLLLCNNEGTVFIYDYFVSPLVTITCVSDIWQNSLIIPIQHNGIYIMQPSQSDMAVSSARELVIMTHLITLMTLGTSALQLNVTLPDWHWIFMRRAWTNDVYI